MTGTGEPIRRVAEGEPSAIDVTALVSDALHIITVDLAYTDSSGVIFAIPANAFVMFAFVVVDTLWDVAPTFTVGTATDLDAVVMNHEHRLDDEDPSFIVHPIHCVAGTDFYATWNQNGASAGAAELIVFYFQRD